MIPYLSSVVSWLLFLFLIHPLHLVCVIGVGGNGFGLLQRPEVNIRYLPSSLTILFLEIKSLPELEACWFRETGWPRRPRSRPASVPPVLRLQTHHTWLLYTASGISLRCLCLQNKVFLWLGHLPGAYTPLILVFLSPTSLFSSERPFTMLLIVNVTRLRNI